MTSEKTCAMDCRPGKYWSESDNREQRLSRIQGRVKRDSTREALEEGCIGALNAIGSEVANETLSEPDREARGAIHPSLMGGECCYSLLLYIFGVTCN
jgi:hypothetical protein